MYGGFFPFSCCPEDASAQSEHLCVQFTTEESEAIWLFCKNHPQRVSWHLLSLRDGTECTCCLFLLQHRRPHYLLGKRTPTIGMCLKPSPQGVGLLGKVIAHLGGGAWLEKVGHWGRVLRLCSLTPLPGCSLVDRQCDRLPHTPAAMASPTHSEPALLFLP